MKKILLLLLLTLLAGCSLERNSKIEENNAPETYISQPEVSKIDNINENKTADETVNEIDNELDELDLDKDFPSADDSELGL
jgi:hypothetical protein